MSVYAVVAGNQIVTLDANQYKQLLIDGTMTDQALNVAYAGTSDQATLTTSGTGNGYNLTLALGTTNTPAANIFLKSANTAGAVGVRMNSDQGANADLDLNLWGSAYASGQFGLASLKNWATIRGFGTSLLGVLLGTVTAIPVVFGTNNAEVGRAFSSGGWYLGGPGSDPGAGYVAAKNGLVATGLGVDSTHQHTVPNVASDTYALLAATQTLTHKTLSAPLFLSAPNVQNVNYTIASTDLVVEHTSVTAHTYTLPSASATSGQIFSIINGPAATAGTVTITPAGSDVFTLGGSLYSNTTPFSLTTGRTLMLLSLGGTAWAVLAYVT